MNCSNENNCYTLRDSYVKLILGTRTLSKNGKFLYYDDNGSYLTKTWNYNTYTQCKNNGTTILAYINNYRSGYGGWTYNWFSGSTGGSPTHVYIDTYGSATSYPILCQAPLSPSAWGYDSHYCFRQGYSASFNSSVCTNSF